MYTGCMPYDTVWFTKKATTQSCIQISERFSLSNPGHVIREPSHNGLGAASLQGPWTLHASKQSSHGSLAADNTHGDWLGATQGGHGFPKMGDDSTCTVLSYQLEDAVHQSHTMYNMALMSQLFHKLAESHGQASMEVEVVSRETSHIDKSKPAIINADTTPQTWWNHTIVLVN